MSEEVLVNALPGETRLALIENGTLQELFVERSRRSILVGHIFKGKVTRVLQGMQAAFIDIGLERTAFLHVSDVLTDKQDLPISEDESQKNISELMREGEEVLVQVIKDPLGTKGARLTTQLSIPSRYLVFMPSLEKAGVSHKITNEAERERLENIINQACTDLTGNFIIRTNAEGVSEDELLADIKFLLKMWESVAHKAQLAKAGEIVFEELNLVLRSLRDLKTAQISRIRIDNQQLSVRSQEFLKTFVPSLANFVEFYEGENPIFDLYAVEDQIARSLKPKVLLKSGGSIVIEQTEAMTTVDVNTGGFVGHRNVDDTIFRTNLEATGAIAKQLRLRNLGGIIILDFIDMENEEHQREVLRALTKALEKDSAKTTIGQFSELGLVEITRKRTRESMVRLLCEPCPMCEQRGYVKSAESICYDIFRDILRQAKAYGSQALVIIASTQVVDRLLDEESNNLADLESMIERRIQLKVEATYGPQQYDVVLT